MKKLLPILFSALFISSIAYAQPTWVVSGAPIGDASVHDYTATYNTTITHVTNTGETFEVEITAGSATGVHIYSVESAPNTTTGITGVGSNDRYYGVFLVGDNAATYTATYTYGPTGTGNPHVGSGASDVDMFGRNDNSVTSWATVSASNNAGTRIITKTGHVGREEFMLGSTGAALPVELLDFNARWTDSNFESAEVYWETATEINNEKFIVERSIDGINWVEILETPGAGPITTTEPIEYSEFDLDPYTNGPSYYRLKQVDFDGQFGYSNVVVLNVDKDLDIINLYPNPVDDQFTYLVVSSKDVEVYISIVNTLGQLMYKEQANLKAGLAQRGMNVLGLAEGDYIIHINTTDGEDKVSRRFVVNREG